MALNIITAKFCSGATQAWASEAWQYDYGQVLQFDGLELPEAYQVHFSNVPMTGTAITQIGGADGVTVPDQYFATGEPIYAWVYLHEGEDDGETVYMVTIPVKKRPQPSDEVPTPEEQSAIDQAIAALNIAVEKADEAITHYPTIIDGTWHVWDVTTEAYVDTGVQAQGAKGDKGNKGDNGISPTVTVTDITNGHRVTITDADGMKTFDVMNGAQGDPGGKGDPGAPGTSPTVTVTEITGGHRVTITDESGEHTFNVMDGEDGTTPTVDAVLSTTSENPVQNKVITQELTDVKDNLNQMSTATQADVGKALKAKTVTDGKVTEWEFGEAGIYELTQQDKIDIAALVEDVYVETVTGTTPVITGVANHRYICGEVSTITITPPATGIVDVIFESGTTAAVLTLPSTVMMPEWFDVEALETERVYEINISDGTYGSVMSWAQV